MVDEVNVHANEDIIIVRFYFACPESYHYLVLIFNTCIAIQCLRFELLRFLYKPFRLFRLTYDGCCDSLSSLWFRMISQKANH